MDDESKKWKLGISAKVKDETISPELRVTDTIDANQKATLTIDKDKVYVDYELSF